jgi:hypothetical protein
MAVYSASASTNLSLPTALCAVGSENKYAVRICSTHKSFEHSDYQGFRFQNENQHQLLPQKAILGGTEMPHFKK